MNSNHNHQHQVQQNNNYTYKDLLLRKLSYAVIFSILSQLIILQLYILIKNVNIFHPTKWIYSSFRTMTLFSTWIYMIPLISIIFSQSLICAKDYVVNSKYCSTRFQKFVATFSLHNLILLFLHVLVGATIIWLFQTVSDGYYKNLIENCKENLMCLNEATFALILSGFWTGFYYFLKIYVAEKTLQFPIINQRKFLQLKSELSDLIKDSVLSALWPCVYYIIFYYFYGQLLANNFRNFFSLFKTNDQPEINSLILYFHIWFFAAFYYLNMNLMRFYFNLFLTESVEFPILEKSNSKTTNLTLQESIINTEWPIVQNLACLDLYLLAKWSPIRRQRFFTISQPGGHPHNWNYLVENVLKLFNEYTELINKTIDVPSLDHQKKLSQIIQAPIIQNPDRFRNLRNMAQINDEHDCYYNNLENLGTTKKEITLLEQLLAKITLKLTNTWTFIKIITGIQFLFGDLPQANIRQCLANGNCIIWASEGITQILCVSLTEDRFGVVQKDLPVIITSLVNLKQSLDKLQKIPSLARKMDDFNYKMKGALIVAVKRSLFNVTRNFERYLNDIPLNKDIIQYLQLHVISKS